MVKIFVSHSSKDDKIIDMIHDQLEYEGYDMWVDHRDGGIDPGDNWQHAIQQALKDANLGVFVISSHSVASKVCMDEWSVFLDDDNRPLYTLLLEKPQEMPFRLRNIQHVDLSENFSSGIARFIEFLKRKHPPIDVPAPADPAAVADKMAHIEPVMEAQRQQAARDAEQRAARPRQRRVNYLPIPPHYRDRDKARADLAAYLIDPAARVIAVIGRGGMGKTALAGTVLDDLVARDATAVDGVVYLTARAGAAQTGLTVDRIFRDVGRLLDQAGADALDAIWREPGGTVGEKTGRLLNRLDEGQYVIVLDNLEDLLDANGAITDPDLRDFLEVCLAAPSHARIVITTREKLAVPPDRRGAYRPLPLDEGLPGEDAVAMLRDLDPGGACGLRDGDPDVLRALAEKTQGVPRALELIAAILADEEQPLTPADLLTRDDLFGEHVTEKLAREAYRRLDEGSRRVLEALAVLNTPANPVAVEYLLAPWAPEVDVPAALGALVRHHHVTLDKRSGLYSLHPIDRDYAYRLLPEEASAPQDTPAAPYTRANLARRAADYYAENRLPRELWRTIDDLAPQLAEFEQRLAAGDFDTACRLLNDIDFDYLLLWGHSRRAVPLREALLGKLSSQWLQGNNHTQLGLHYEGLSRPRDAIAQYEAALAIDRAIGDRQGEGADLGNLGNAYSDLGETRRAIDFYQQALDIARAIGDRRGEGIHLGNLGIAYRILGRPRDAIAQYEDALAIARAIGDRRGEGHRLFGMANAYLALEETAEAIRLARQAVAIHQEINYPRGQCWGLIALGWALIAAGSMPDAQDAFREATALDVPEDNLHASAGLGTACALLADRDGALAAFREAAERASALLAKTDSLYEAWYTLGLARTGLAALGAESAGEALAAYRRAVEIASPAGALAEQRRQLDALAGAPNVDAEVIATARAVLAG